MNIQISRRGAFRGQLFNIQVIIHSVSPSARPVKASDWEVKFEFITTNFIMCSINIMIWEEWESVRFNGVEIMHYHKLRLALSVLFCSGWVGSEIIEMNVFGFRSNFIRFDLLAHCSLIRSFNFLLWKFIFNCFHSVCCLVKLTI